MSVVVTNEAARQGKIMLFIQPYNSDMDQLMKFSKPSSSATRARSEKAMKLAVTSNALHTHFICSRVR
ncbi:hypothetical protein PC114_g12984 [Phytophthora cactorum]|nr:hypothetical protein PC114_g12984 [Phytophthora cactorum]